MHEPEARVPAREVGDRARLDELLHRVDVAGERPRQRASQRRARRDRKGPRDRRRAARPPRLERVAERVEGRGDHRRSRQRLEQVAVEDRDARLVAAAADHEVALASGVVEHDDVRDLAARARGRRHGNGRRRRGLQTADALVVPERARVGQQDRDGLRGAQRAPAADREDGARAGFARRGGGGLALGDVRVLADQRAQTRARGALDDRLEQPGVCEAAVGDDGDGAGTQRRDLGGERRGDGAAARDDAGRGCELADAHDICASTSPAASSATAIASMPACNTP